MAFLLERNIVHKNTLEIEILTPSGFQKFGGIVKKKRGNLLKILFSDYSEITCTESHRFVENDIEIFAKSLVIGNKLNEKLITDIIKIPDILDVYDAVDVENGNLYITNDIISHNCDFASSSYTLISGSKLTATAVMEPVFQKDNLKVFFPPKENHSYVCTVDTSEGIHLDSSAFVVFDITQMPYKIVAIYKDNTISSLSYPELIMRICRKYNNAYVLVETNSVGITVANCIFYEMEYEFVYFTLKEDINEGAGFPGIRTTKKVKAIGTACLKELIEQDQLELNSEDIIAELSVFVKKGASYASSDPSGVNDDLTSCLWLFAYLTKQPIFSDLTNTNIRAILAAKTEEYISANMIPFGMISTVDGESEAIQFDIPVNHPDAWIFANYEIVED